MSTEVGRLESDALLGGLVIEVERGADERGHPGEEERLERLDHHRTDRDPVVEKMRKALGNFAAAATAE